jgi:hypothetical protein
MPRFSSNVEYNTNDVLQIQRLPNFDVVLHSNLVVSIEKFPWGANIQTYFWGGMPQFVAPLFGHNITMN